MCYSLWIFTGIFSSLSRKKIKVFSFGRKRSYKISHKLIQSLSQQTSSQFSYFSYIKLAISIHSCHNQWRTLETYKVANNNLPFFSLTTLTGILALKFKVNNLKNQEKPPEKSVYRFKNKHWTRFPHRSHDNGKKVVQPLTFSYRPLLNERLIFTLGWSIKGNTSCAHVSRQLTTWESKTKN